MKRTIIYVFGPKRLASLYFSNKELEQKDGGWLKIGQTSSGDNDNDKREIAIDRIHKEVKTGIPEVCQLLDVFEYPEQQGKTDDKIRKLLTDDIYNLECSKEHNKTVEKYEIKAGQEFIYGVTRNQVFGAVAKFERDLIMENYGKDGFNDLMECLKTNKKDELLFEQKEDETIVKQPTDKLEWCDKLWNAVIAKIKGTISTNISNPVGRPYIDFSSPSRPDFFYDLGYSVRYGLANVSIITYKGEGAKKELNSYIEENDILSQIPNLVLKQGAKKKDKWAWITSDTLDKSFEELVDWFANTILTFYKVFEKK